MLSGFEFKYVLGDGPERTGGLNIKFKTATAVPPDGVELVISFAPKSTALYNLKMVFYAGTAGGRHGG